MTRILNYTRAFSDFCTPWGAYAKNFNFGMEVASHNRSKKTSITNGCHGYLNNQGAKIKNQNGKNICTFEELSLLNEKKNLIPGPAEAVHEAKASKSFAKRTYITAGGLGTL